MPRATNFRFRKLLNSLNLISSKTPSNLLKTNKLPDITTLKVKITRAARQPLSFPIGSLRLLNLRASEPHENVDSAILERIGRGFVKNLLLEIQVRLKWYFTGSNEIFVGAVDEEDALVCDEGSYGCSDQEGRAASEAGCLAASPEELRLCEQVTFRYRFVHFIN